MEIALEGLGPGRRPPVRNIAGLGRSSKAPAFLKVVTERFDLSDAAVVDVRAGS